MAIPVHDIRQILFEKENLFEYGEAGTSLPHKNDTIVGDLTKYIKKLLKIKSRIQNGEIEVTKDDFRGDFVLKKVKQGEEQDEDPVEIPAAGGPVSNEPTSNEPGDGEPNADAPGDQPENQESDVDTAHSVVELLKSLGDENLQFLARLSGEEKNQMSQFIVRAIEVLKSPKSQNVGVDLKPEPVEDSLPNRIPRGALLKNRKSRAKVSEEDINSLYEALDILNEEDAAAYKKAAEYNRIKARQAADAAASAPAPDAAPVTPTEPAKPDEPTPADEYIKMIDKELDVYRKAPIHLMNDRFKGIVTGIDDTKKQAFVNLIVSKGNRNTNGTSGSDRDVSGYIIPVPYDNVVQIDRPSNQKGIGGRLRNFASRLANG